MESVYRLLLVIAPYFLGENRMDGMCCGAVNEMTQCHSNDVHTYCVPSKSTVDAKTKSVDLK